MPKPTDVSATQVRYHDVRFQSVQVDRDADGTDKPEGFIAGYASTDALDSYETILAPGLFDESIRDRGIRGPRGIKLLCDHMRSRVAGVITKLEQHGNRLYIEAQLNLKISYARDTYEAAKMNNGLSFSVGFRPTEWSWDDDDEILTFTKADLVEVSVVAFPANEECEMTEIKSANDDAPTTVAAFERMLVSRGLVEGRNAARRITQVVKACAALFNQAPALEAPEPETAPPVPADEPDLAAALEALRATRVALEARNGKTTN